MCRGAVPKRRAMASLTLQGYCSRVADLVAEELVVVSITVTWLAPSFSVLFCPARVLCYALL